MRELIVTFIILLILLLGGDYLLKKPIGMRGSRSLIDVFIHGLIALVVVSPLRTRGLLFLAFIIGTLLDIDHFIVARSWRISDAVDLKNRPYTHSITFAVIVGIIAWGFTRSGEIAFTIGIAIISHVLRDAPSGKTYIFWPANLESIPYWSYIIFEIAILGFCWLFQSLRV